MCLNRLPPVKISEEVPGVLTPSAHTIIVFLLVLDPLRAKQTHRRSVKLQSSHLGKKQHNYCNISKVITHQSNKLHVLDYFLR